MSGAIFHYIIHGYCKSILCGVAGILMSQVGTRSIKEMGGLTDCLPLTTILALLGFFSIGGVPPTIGFMSKFMIFARARPFRFYTSFFNADDLSN